MAFIRVVRQGHPVDPDLFVDLGPSVGRTTHTRGAIFGGEMVVAESTRSRDLRLQREAMARYNASIAAKASQDRYYATHRTEILEKRRERRRLAKSA